MGYFNDGMGQINKLSVNGEVSQPSRPSVCGRTLRIERYAWWEGVMRYRRALKLSLAAPTALHRWLCESSTQPAGRLFAQPACG